jgi:hypothetical protein
MSGIRSAFIGVSALVFTMLALSPGISIAAIGNSAQFTATSNSYIAAESSNELKTFSALTLEAWIKPISGGGEWALIMGKQYNSADSNPWYSYRFLASSANASEKGFPRRVSFDIAPVTTSGEVGVESTTVVPVDVWTHIAGVYDGSTMKIYINGVLENTVPQTGALRGSDLPMYIGAAPWTFNNNYNGWMDELRVWNVARTQEEIQYSMKRGLTGTENGLVAYWQFNDTVGSPTAADSSPYDHVGTLYRAAIVADTTLPICYEPLTGMVSWWGGDGNGADLIGDNDGIAVNGAGYANGMVGEAFSFDGANDYVDLPAAASTLLNNEAGSITAWVQPSAVGDNDMIAVFGSGVSGEGVGLGIWDNVRIYHHTIEYDWQTTTPVAAGEWTLLTYTWDGTTESLYKNGVFSESRPRNFSYVPGQGRIGNGFWGDPANPFPGLIDEVQTYGRTLTAEEIASLYLAGSQGACRSCVPQSETLVSWWRGDEDATDFVGSLDGTFAAATYASGMVGQSFSLDGVDDVVDIPHPIPSSLLGSASKTVTAWVNPSSHPAEIFMMGNIFTSGASFRLVTNASGQLGFDVSDYVGYSSLVVPVNQWSSVAGTWDGSSYRACLNGTCEVVPGLPAQALADGLFTIGKANLFFPGPLDEVTLHTAALTESQLAEIANARGSGICTATDTTPAAFAFTDQTGVAPGSVITSDSITVTGIDFPTDVSITACTGPGPCEYEINGSGTWLTDPTTVMNNNTVAVRQTASGSYGTATDLTLDIGGVSDTFTVTTLNAYSVTANAGGNGSGTVASDVGSISYSYPAVNTGTSALLEEGSSITLTATAGTGSTAAWSGCAGNGGTSTAATCSFSSLDGDKTVTATFTLNQYTLTYAAGDHGSISGTTPQTVDHGSDGTAVTAVADANYHFVQWSDGSTANPRTDTSVTGDISVTATFAIDQYTLTYAAGDHGSISGTTPQTVDHGSDGTVVTAVPDANYHFVQWSDGSTANPRTDTNVIGDISVTASFAIDRFTLTVTLAGSGQGTVSSDPTGIDCGTACSETFAAGTVVTLTATAEEGSRFAGWSGDAACADGTITVTGDLTCTATFSKFPWIMFNNILTGSGEK